jgi:WD40 repeat protein
VTAPTHDDGRASAVSPDGTRLAVAHRCWSLTLHGVIDSTDKIVFEILDRPIHSPTFSLDGSKFALVVANMLINIWDTITGDHLGRSQKHGAVIESLALSRDGTRNLSICDHSSEATVQTWQVGEDSGIIFDTNGDPPISATFFPDGARFITTSKSGTIRMWDMASSTPLSVLFESTLPLHLWRNDFAISSDGTRLISCYFLGDIVNCQVLKSFDAMAAKFSPDGACVALVLGADVQILDAVTGAILQVYQLYTFGYGRISFSLDSTRLFCWTYDGIGRVIDLTCSPTSVNTEVLSCVYPPDRMMIQSSQHDRWYRATNGARLIWLALDMEPVWLATGKPTGFRRLIMGRSDIVVLDMDDYLEVLPVGAAWRKGGVRYTDFSTADQASALMSETA